MQLDWSLQLSYLPCPCEFVCIQTLIRLHFDLKRQHSDDVEAPCVHFVETGPSLLQDMPWILHRDYKVCPPYHSRDAHA